MYTEKEIQKLSVIDAANKLGIKDKKTLLLCMEFYNIYVSTYKEIESLNKEIESLNIYFESALAGNED